jgi:hypothetical protein
MVVCPFVLFRLVIVLSVLPFTDSDYLFSIFKLVMELYSLCVYLQIPISILTIKKVSIEMNPFFRYLFVQIILFFQSSNSIYS